MHYVYRLTEGVDRAKYMSLIKTYGKKRLW